MSTLNPSPHKKTVVHLLHSPCAATASVRSELMHSLHNRSSTSALTALVRARFWNSVMHSLHTLKELPGRTGILVRAANRVFCSGFNASEQIGENRNAIRDHCGGNRSPRRARLRDGHSADAAPRSTGRPGSPAARRADLPGPHLSGVNHGWACGTVRQSFSSPWAAAPPSRGSLRLARINGIEPEAKPGRRRASGVPAARLDSERVTWAAAFNQPEVRPGFPSYRHKERDL